MAEFTMWMPKGAKAIISALEMHGFEAYAVGGCVRDSLLGGTPPHDWDICTNAKPVEVLKVFSDKRVIETGIKHGTVTIIMPDMAYEVTTFRVDGKYSDGRHPDKVTFTGSLKDDLSRRDFTINAMAYSDRTGLIDPFGGMEDLSNWMIACVGDEDQRFAEDALRIMRALRFASTLRFAIEKDTAESIRRNKELLNNIAQERIASELCKLLMGRRAFSVLAKYSDVIATIIPELAPCIGFNQNNTYHAFTVYDHIIHAVSHYNGDDVSIKMALLLHDIGKPQCYTEDERGGHFHGHGVPSSDMADAVMRRLRFDNRTREEVVSLVLYHDAVIEPQPRVVKRWMNRIGANLLLKLMQVRAADIKAHTPVTQESRIGKVIETERLIHEILQSEQCFTMRDMAINGTHIMRLGIPEGKQVGEVLRHLMDMVINGEIQNNLPDLMDEARRYAAEKGWSTT